MSRLPRFLPLFFVCAFAPAVFAQSANVVLDGFGSIPTPPSSNVSINVPISITNSGPGSANDVQLTLTIPTGATFMAVQAGAPLSCTTPPLFAAGNVVCSTPSLSPGNRVSISVTVQLTASPGTTVKFDATLTSSNAVTSPQTASTTVSIPQPADVNVSIAAPATAYIGETYANVVTLTNRGPGTALQLSVGVVPGGGGLTSLPPTAPPGWTCVSARECTIDSFPPGTATFTFPVSASELGDKTATASAFLLNDPSYVDNKSGVATTTIQMQPQTDLSVSISATPSVVSTRDTQTYTVQVTNTGTTPAIHVLVNGQIPGRMLSNSCNLGLPTCDYFKLDPGATNTTTWVMENNAISPGTLTGTVTVTAANVSGSRTASTTTANLGEPVVDLQATLAAPASVLAGGSSLWTIGMINNGPDAVRGWSLDIDMPPYSLVTGIIPSDSRISCVLVGNLARCLGTGLPNNRMTAQVTALTSAYYAQPVHVTVTAFTDDNDPHPENNVVSADSPIGPPAADLSMTLTTDTPRIPAGESAVFKVTLANIGNLPAPAPTVTIPLAPAFELAAPPTPPCSATPAKVVCTFVTIDPENKMQTSLTLRPTGPGTSTATATASTTATEPRMDNNTASAAVTVVEPGSRRRAARH